MYECACGCDCVCVRVYVSKVSSLLNCSFETTLALTFENSLTGVVRLVAVFLVVVAGVAMAMGWCPCNQSVTADCHCGPLPLYGARSFCVLHACTRWVCSHCNALQGTATRCHALQHATHCTTAIYHCGPTTCDWAFVLFCIARMQEECICALPSTAALATHCNTLQHTATHCTTLQHIATHCNTLEHTATHCNILQHDMQQVCFALCTHARDSCNTLQHTASHCNALQHYMQEVCFALCTRSRLQENMKIDRFIICVGVCKDIGWVGDGGNALLQCAAVRCSTFCSVLQCAAATLLGT